MPTHNVEMVGPNGKIFKLLREGKRKYQKIIQIGDLVCFDDFSAHPHSPEDHPDTLETFRLVKEFNANLRKAAPKADIYYVEGNHEIRLERYLVRQAPQLLPLNCLTIPALFELEKHNIKWKAYRDRLKIDGLKVTHGSYIRPKGGNSARAELEANDFGSGVSGHTHRQGWTKDHGGVWLELGNLADPDYSVSAKYMADRTPQWHSGLGQGTCCLDDNTGKHHWFLSPIEIKDQHFIVDGILF